MDNKKYQVFVSSTYRDLEDARDKIIETILSLYHFPIGMEMFSADDDEQWEIIQETINVSDYYVVIIGHRYGTVAADGRSFTEKEYDYAKEKGIPILAFVRNREVATLPSERDSDPSLIAKLDAFVDKATGSKMCDFWMNVDDLATKVAIALPKMFRRKPQIGWVRGSEAVSKEILQELAGLSTENRELRNENEELLSRFDGKKPSVDLNVNGGKCLDLLCDSFDPTELIEVPSTFTANDIPDHLKSYVSDRDIENYNNKLPSQRDIDNYSRAAQLYYLINSESLDLCFEISNYGRAKANDVYVTVTFPDFVRVIDKHEAADIDEPVVPIPNSPLVEAEEKFKNDHSPFSDLLNSSKYYSSFNEDYSPLYARSHAVDRLPISSPFYACRKSGENEVTLNVKELIHTREVVFDDDILLIPLCEGSGDAEISIICEEYVDSVSFTIPIVVKLRTDS